MKGTHKLHVILCYLALPYLFLWYFFVAMNALKAGYYPHYPDHPRMYLFGNKEYRDIMDFFMGIAFFSVPVWIVYGLTMVIMGNYKLKRVHLIVFIISAILLWFSFFIDPAFEWYLD